MRFPPHLHIIDIEFLPRTCIIIVIDL